MKLHKNIFLLFLLIAQTAWAVEGPLDGLVLEVPGTVTDGLTLENEVQSGPGSKREGKGNMYNGEPVQGSAIKDGIIPSKTTSALEAAKRRVAEKEEYNNDQNDMSTDVIDPTTSGPTYSQLRTENTMEELRGTKHFTVLKNSDGTIGFKDNRGLVQKMWDGFSGGKSLKQMDALKIAHDSLEESATKKALNKEITDRVSKAFKDGKKNQLKLYERSGDILDPYNNDNNNDNSLEKVANRYKKEYKSGAFEKNIDGNPYGNRFKDYSFTLIKILDTFNEKMERLAMYTDRENFDKELNELIKKYKHEKDQSIYSSIESLLQKLQEKVGDDTLSRKAFSNVASHAILELPEFKVTDEVRQTVKFFSGKTNYPRLLTENIKMLGRRPKIITSYLRENNYPVSLNEKMDQYLEGKPIMGDSDYRSLLTQVHQEGKGLPLQEEVFSSKNGLAIPNKYIKCRELRFLVLSFLRFQM